jgi:TonB family protein
MRPTFIATALISPLFFSVAALAAPPVTDATAPSARRLSTGVQPAHVLYSPSISVPASAVMPTNAEFVVRCNVTEAGRAQDVEVLKSASTQLDSQVVAAVRQFRFRPATLDRQPVATEMTLTVFVER